MRLTKQNQDTKIIGALVLLYIFLSLMVPVDSNGLTVPPNQWWGSPSWSPDGKSVFVATPQPKTTRFDKTGKIIGANAATLKGKNLVLRTSDYTIVSILDPYIRPLWSPDSKLLAATKWEMGTSPDTLAIYDAVTGKCSTKFHGPSVDQFSWSPDSQKLLCAAVYSISICDIKTKTQSQLQTDDEYSWECPVWDPSGGNRMAAFASVPSLKRSSHIKIWDSETLATLQSIDVPSEVGQLGWSKDGRNLLYSEPGKIKTIDAASGVTKTVVTTDECATFSYSPNGDYLAFRDRDRLTVLDGISFAKRFVVQGPTNGSFGWSWSPNEKYILLTNRDTIAAFDSGTGKPVSFKTWTDYIERVQFTPDGKSLMVSTQYRSPAFVPIKLTTPVDQTSIMHGGKVGGPKWSSFPCPSSLEECFAELDKNLTTAQKTKFTKTKEDDLFIFGGGSIVSDTLILDVYSKWDKFGLKRFFEQKGISDGRDLFGIVIDSYWRRLNGKPSNLDKQIQLHRNWWQSRAPIVEENRQLSEGFKKYSAIDQNGRSFSIASLKEKLKVVSFVDTNGVLSAEQIESLQSLRTKHSTSELVFVVFIIPPENLGDDLWPSNTSHDSTTETLEATAKKIAAFRQNPGTGFVVATAPRALCKEYLDFQYANVSRYNSHGPPQTLVVGGDGMVTIRLNGFDRDWSEKLLNHQIIELLKAQSAPKKLQP